MKDRKKNLKKVNELLELIFPEIPQTNHGRVLRDMILMTKDRYDAEELAEVIVSHLPKLKRKVFNIINEKQTLKDWLPSDLNVFALPKNQKEAVMMMLNMPIKEIHKSDEENFDQSNPFTQNHVHTWVKLENDFAVGFNQNPKLGWTLPFKRLR